MSNTDVSDIELGDGDSFEAFNRAMGADGDATPYPAFAEARAAAPVHGGAAAFTHVGDGEAADDDLQIYTAYTYDAVHRILGDGATFSSAGYEEVMGAVMGRSILMMDEPEHHGYRSVIAKAFTRQAMQRWETELVEPLVNGMVDQFVDDGRADLVRQLTFPFPVQVIADLLGLPRADLADFHRLAVELIGVSVNWERAVAASEELRRYFCGLVEERRHDPADDMVSALAHAEHDGQRLTDDEICAFLRLLLPAGAETTYRSSSNLLFGLLSNPDQLEAVRADRSLLPHAIEEGIRWEPPLLMIMRTATRDTDVCGVAIPAGAMVVVNMGSANHDESRWDDPERFDIHRRHRPHIGFAHGPHMCLGMHLARMETAVAVNALLDRLPALRLDPEGSHHYISGVTFRAPPRLDVVWG